VETTIVIVVGTVVVMAIIGCVVYRVFDGRRYIRSRILDTVELLANRICMTVERCNAPPTASAPPPAEEVYGHTIEGDGE